MGVLQRFERRLEGLVSGAFGRAFKAQVEPVEIAAALQRETDDRRAVVGEGRILVPNDFVVELGTSDFARLSPYAEALGEELADMVSEHAAGHGYSFVGPVRVAFDHVAELDTGFFRLRGGVSAGPEPEPLVAAAADAMLTPAPPAARRHASPNDPTMVTAPPPPAGPHLVVSTRDAGAPGTPTTPAVQRRIVLTGRPMLIGREADADIKLEDTGVSRRHAEIRVDDDAFELVELGSTNGTTVNGRPIARHHLVNGDRVVMGRTTLVFRDGDAD